VIPRDAPPPEPTVRNRTTRGGMTAEEMIEEARRRDGDG
jgi:hypothetical protein